MKRIVALLCCCATTASADFIELRRNANVYEDSNRFSQQLAHFEIEPEPVVNLIATGTARENSYVEVFLPNGNDRGWVHTGRGRMFSGFPLGVTLPADRTVLRSGSFAIAPDSMVAHFIDVGQGDATLLEFSCGLALIDTGGENTDEVNGAELLITYLNTIFDRRPDLNRTLDLVVLTHGHADHTAGAVRLVDPNNHFTIRNIVDNGRTDGSGRFGQRTLQEHGAANTNINHQSIRGGDITSISNITNNVIDPLNCAGTDPLFRVLWGSLTTNPGWSNKEFTENQNNHSVAVRVDFGNSSFLFTGDMQAPALETLVTHYDGTQMLNVDVHQVGHHGSHNALIKEFMEAMSPDVAVISSGNSNLSRHQFSAFSFAHPRDDAVNLLRDPNTGVSFFREQSVNVPVGDRGACSAAFCGTFRPPVFESWDIERAIYNTGWGGTVRLSANSQGEMRIARN